MHAARGRNRILKIPDAADEIVVLHTVELPIGHTQQLAATLLPTRGSEASSSSAPSPSPARSAVASHSHLGPAGSWHPYRRSHQWMSAGWFVHREGQQRRWRVLEWSSSWPPGCLASCAPAPSSMLEHKTKSIEGAASMAVGREPRQMDACHGTKTTPSHNQASCARKPVTPAAAAVTARRLDMIGSRQ
jgi:hypothetical protein